MSRCFPSIECPSCIANSATLQRCGEVVKTIAKPAIKTYEYIRDNFSRIVKFTLSWGVIVTFLGLLYGFEATALPLSIGLGCGMGFGALLGIVSWKALQSTAYRLEDHRDKNTIWGHLRQFFNQDEGTRALLTTIVVTVVFAALAIFPLEVGIVLGVIVGNQIAINIIFHEPEDPSRPPSVALQPQPPQQSRTQRLEKVEQELDALKAQLAALNRSLQIGVPGHAQAP